MIDNRFYLGIDIRAKLSDKGKILATAITCLLLAPLFRQIALLNLGANEFILFAVSACLFALFNYYLLFSIVLYPHFARKATKLLLQDKVYIFENYNSAFQRSYIATATIYEFVEIEFFPQVKHTDLTEIKEGLARLKEVTKMINKHKENEI